MQQFTFPSSQASFFFFLITLKNYLIGHQKDHHSQDN